MLSCEVCKYMTKRQDNFDRHLNGHKHKQNIERKQLEVTAQKTQVRILLQDQRNRLIEDFDKHLSEMNNEDEYSAIVLQQIDILQRQRSLYNEEHTSTELVIVDQNGMQCNMCLKTYKSKQQLNQHILKCKIVDNDTCAKCMVTFASPSSKSRHKIRNNCQPASIFTYLIRKGMQPPNVIENMLNPYILEDSTYINDYGKERVDFITYDLFYKLVSKSAYKIIAYYFQLSNLNKDFLENYNVKCVNGLFHIHNNGRWNVIGKTDLLNKIYNDYGSKVYFRKEEYKEHMKKEIHMTEQKWSDIEEVTNYLMLDNQGRGKDIREYILAAILECPITVENMNFIKEYNASNNNSILQIEESKTI